MQPEPLQSTLTVSPQNGWCARLRAMSEGGCAADGAWVGGYTQSSQLTHPLFARNITIIPYLQEKVNGNHKNDYQGQSRHG
jgi:hypothetical protein